MSVCQQCGKELPQSARPHRRWCSERCRKASYSRPCPDCGKPMGGSEGNGPNAPRQCRDCRAAARRRLGRQRVLDAIDEWARAHDGRPPNIADFEPSAARKYNRLCKRQVPVPEPGRWPGYAAVRSYFPSWGAAVKAAGYEPLKRRAPS